MKLRLHHRYSLVIVALLLSAVAIVSGAAVLTFGTLSQRAETASARVMSDNLREQAVKAGRDIALLASQILADPLYNGNVPAMDEDVDSMRRHKGILAIRVADPSGRILYGGMPQISIDQRDRNAVLHDALATRDLASSLNGDILSVAAPILVGGQLLGVVHLDISLKGLGANVAEMRQEMARISAESSTSLFALIGSAALVFGVVGLLVGILVARGLSHPIKTLSAMTRRIGQGEYDVEGPTERSDEIGDLARDLHKMASELKQVQRMSQLAMVGEMAVGVAHELNQPLNTIRMASDNALVALDMPEMESSYLRNKLELISQLAARMGEEIQRMCAVGRRDERRIVFDPTVSIRDALTLHEGGLAAEGIQVALDLPDVAPDGSALAVQGLPSELTQVIVNLIGNARDAIVERGGTPLGRLRSVHGHIRIALGVDVPSRQLRLSVADNGGGVPPEILRRIFDPFFTTKEVNKGTGLGLSISYGIVTGMGGQIDARNQADGALFTVILPMADEHAARAAE